MVIWETVLLGVLAIIIGMIVTYPVLLYLHYNPIPLSGEIAESMKLFGAEPVLPFSIKPDIFINQIVSVIIIVLVAVFYPLSVILKFDVLKAMRS